MSRDQMQDVFPINFEFVKGEQPSGTKLTGWIKQTDVAFSRIGKAIGDPWDTQAHAAGLTSALLSPQRLGQPSLARSLGPVDWVSPQGASWNQAVESSFSVILYSNRNSWALGYPLIKVTTAIDTDPTISHVTPLVWNTDIVPDGDTTGVFTTEKSTLEEVTQHGDFHVNYYTGVITVFRPPVGGISLTISNMNMFGPGVPWGTANVIPTWDQSTLCTVEENDGSPSGGLSTYTITLPNVDTGTRVSGAFVGANTPYGEGAASQRSDVAYNLSCPGATAKYRLPYSLTSAFSTDDAIPEGYMYIWDHATARVIQSLVTFYYIDENSITVVTPQGWLTEGDTVRILVSGTSVSEAVGYLLSATRDNRHVGLATGSDGKTLAYTSPISHDHLADLYVGNLDNLETDREKFEFRKSSYPINPHPQYLHRAGYMADDATGNSANAMRGDLVFTGMSPNYELGTGPSDGTYGILFGGGSRDAGFGVARLAYEGGADITDWVDEGSTGSAKRFGFHYDRVGVRSGFHGATTHTPWYGAPFYLRGRNSSDAATQMKRGATLAFDLSRRAEMNYIKIMPANRSGVYDVANAPADVGNVHFSTPLDCTQSYGNGLTDRLAVSQIREFRFRGIPYVEDARNTSDSIGEGSVAEFNQYFTSPGMVGADFFNVYSNAIFFSVNPDGKRTSFTETGAAWIGDTSEKQPVGIYYEPDQSDPNGQFAFWTQGEDGNRYETFVFSRNETSKLTTEADIELNTEAGTTIDLKANTEVNLTTQAASGATIYLGTLGTINMQAQGDISLYSAQGTNYAWIQLLDADSGVPKVKISADIDGGSSENYITCGSTYINMLSRGTVSITGEEGVTISADTNIGINSTEDTTITSGSYVHIDATTYIDIDSNSGTYYMRSPPTYDVGDVLLYIDTETWQVRRGPSSSRKYKTNIKRLEDIGWIYDLNPCSFSMKTDLSRTDYGLIAEEAYEVHKNIVGIRNNEPDSVGYIRLIPVLIKAVQDQRKEIEWLKAELDKKSNKRVYKKKK